MTFLCARERKRVCVHFIWWLNSSMTQILTFYELISMSFARKKVKIVNLLIFCCSIWCFFPSPPLNVIFQSKTLKHFCKSAHPPPPFFSTVCPPLVCVRIYFIIQRIYEYMLYEFLHVAGTRQILIKRYTIFVWYKLKITLLIITAKQWWKLQLFM